MLSDLTKQLILVVLAVILLSDDQKAILTDVSLTLKEKREAFKKSFTQSQLDLLKKNRELIKAKMEEFRASLTDEQKAKMKANAQNRLKQMQKWRNWRLKNLSNG